MKKLLIALAFAGVSAASYAQDADANQKFSVATNSFWSNWFIQVGADWDSWYSSEEHENGGVFKKGLFASRRSNPGVALAVGKWFTPGIGLRTKLQGIWGRTVYDREHDRGNKYWVANEHVLFNISNILFGYNENRVFTLSPFAGGGIGRSMTHNLYAMDLSLGLLAEFRFNKHVSAHLEAGWNRFESDIDGGLQETNGERGWKTHDNNMYGEVGLTFNIGKSTWSKVPDVDALNAKWQNQLDALNGRLGDLEAENERLRNQKPVIQRDTTFISQSFKDFITTPGSVFFDLNKFNVANLKDLVNVQALANYAKANNSKILVTGYADSATGTPEINNRLSMNRAETVKGELVKMGVPEENISTTHNGGVDELGKTHPKEFDRRATVQIIEE